LCLLIVVSEGIVRIKTSVIQGKRPNSVHRKFLSLAKVNQTLVDMTETYYVGTIHVGTPPKEFLVDFDTGSDPLWLAGVTCIYEDSGDCKAQKNRYSLAKSSTGRDLHEDFSITYGKGHTEGKYVSDTLGLTAESTGQDTDKSFRFAYATELSKDMSHFMVDGIFGLSFSEKGATGKSYIEYLRDNNVFEEPIFTIWLDRNAANKPVGGEIIFGGRDPDRCGKDLMTVPAGIMKPWWTFDVEKVLLDGQEIAGLIKAITDTGSSLLYLPQVAYNKVAQKYPLADPLGNPTIIDCDEYKDIELNIQIAGKIFKLTAEELIVEISGQCIIGIFPWGDNKWILGDPFIRGYCQIHNYKDETLTFASRLHPNLTKFAPRSNWTYFGFLIPLFLRFF